MGVASMVACAIAIIAAAFVSPVGAVPAQVAAVNPGDTVAAETEAGRIVSISPTGEERELATGLEKPRGVAVMADGSILVAETGRNRIVGLGGRFGSGPPTEVVAVPYPLGLSVTPDDTVYVTLFQAGEMGRVDVDAGTYTPIARDLDAPGDVVARGFAMFVTESGAGVVSTVDGQGNKDTFADGFTQPVGLTFGPGATLFVADQGANRIMRVDAQGEVTPFATVDAPVYVAVEPWIPEEGQPFTVVVTSAEGVVRFDQTGARQGAPIPLDGAIGLATVPGTGPGGTVGPTVPTTAPPPTSSVTPTTGSTPETAPATTRPPRTTTTISEEEGAPSSTSGGILVASLVIIGLIVVGGAIFAVVQRPKSGDKSGFEERPLDTNTVALAFGACAAEEVELAEAEGGLTSLEVQGEAAEKRLASAHERVAVARERLAEVRRAAVASGATPRPAASAPSVSAPAPPAPPAQKPSTGLRLDDLGLTTAAGKAALNAFLKREIEADELEEMWRTLGEDRAIQVVRSARPSSETGAPTEPPADGDDGSDAVDDRDPSDRDRDLYHDDAEGEVEADQQDEDDEAAATRELAEAEEDVAHAHGEIERLHEREDTARGRIVTAKASLEQCQDRHRADLDAEAAAAAEAATVAAARPPSPAAAPAPPEPVVAGDAPGSGADDGPDDPDGDADDPGPEGDDEPAASSTTPAMPTVPDRPPLTADAATVASLRRPPAAPPEPEPIDERRGPAVPPVALDDPDALFRPATDPGAGAPIGRRAEVPVEPLDPGASGGADPVDDPLAAPAAGAPQRDGLDRGLFDTGRDDAGNPRPAGATFPPVADAAPEPDPDPEPEPEPSAEPDPVPGRPVASIPDGQALEPEPVVDPDPMAPRPRPTPPSSGPDDESSLSDVLFRPPPAEAAEAAEPPPARLDDLVFAWPASGFQKRPQSDEPAAAEPDEHAATGADEAPGRPDDDPPRSDLEFL